MFDHVHASSVDAFIKGHFIRQKGQTAWEIVVIKK